MPPQTIFTHMILSNTSSFPYHAPALTTYTTKRKEIITLIRSINTKLDFNSQTFFLAVYYMDEIFTSTNFNVEPDMSNYILLSLCCLIISSKFNENDPKVPDIYKYINICTETTKYKYLFSIDDIRNGEVFILQQLQYKLNYFSVYHYIVFFFAHGVLFKRTYERSEVKHVSASASGNGNGVTKKKMLERIYIHSREILDYYLEDDNEFWFCNCKYNYVIAVVILWKVTEHVLKVSLNDSDNVYKLIYGIDVEECEVYRDICCKVEKIYESKVLKRKKGITSGNGVNTNVNVNSPKELNHSEIKTPTSSNKNTNRYSYVQQQQQNYFMSGISRLRLGEDSSMKVKAMTKGQQQKKQSSNGNSNMQIQSNMSLSTSGFDKIKNDFTGNKIDLLKIHMKKRACSTNKESSRFINNTNNININDLPIQSNNNNNTMNTNLNNSRIDHTNTNTHNNIISQQTSPSSIHPTNSTIKSNEILYHKYIGITKPPLSKTDDYTPATTTSSHTNNNININTTYTSNNRQLYPSNILDKTKKIFDQAKTIKTSYNTIINTQQTGLTYNNNNNNHLRNIPRTSNVDSNYLSGSDLYGNTIIINNNININAYIDKNSNSSSNDNHYYYNNYESYNSYNKGRRDERYNVHSGSNFNSGMSGSGNSNSHQQGKFGKFGTYYDYGYGYSGYKGGKGGKYTGYEYY